MCQPGPKKGINPIPAEEKVPKEKNPKFRKAIKKIMRHVGGVG
jgi:hypothetical protein